jgi:archaeal type IV pilus assembly protein PilA
VHFACTSIFTFSIHIIFIEIMITGLKKASHRAVSPIIAMLLLVAIAVVGGTIIFTFSQGFISSTQISGHPIIESLTVVGYDARDESQLIAHDGNKMSTDASGSLTVDGVKGVEERIAVYVINHSIQKITIAELMFAGTEYEYDIPPDTEVPLGKYAILTKALPTETIMSSIAPEIQAGQEVTIIIGIDSPIKVGRNGQFKLTTTNGAIVVGTVGIGQST